MALRFATKQAAENSAVGKFAGFVAVFISADFAPAHGLELGGWYLFYGRGRTERIASA